MFGPFAPAAAWQTTTSELANNPVIRYKLRVLIYGLLHIDDNPACRARMSNATGPLYIGTPHFTPSEA